jgi:hypothetical protein
MGDKKREREKRACDLPGFSSYQEGARKHVFCIEQLIDFFIIIFIYIHNHAS